VLGVEAFESLMSRYGIPNNSRMVFYDYQSGLYAARAYWTFFYYGETNLLLLNRGIESWLSQNFPLTTSTTVKPPSNYKLRSINHQILATLTDVKNHLNDPKYVIIDCRSKAEYLEGHIPGAINIEWSLTLSPERLFKDQKQLEELFTQNGVTPDKNIITYCRTGVRGAHTWFVLHEILK
jgi:thiosulfate/3-mercaptopyruvate sulfurtransferase